MSSPARMNPNAFGWAHQQLLERAGWLNENIIDPRTEQGFEALLALPDGTVLIDQNGDAVQIEYDDREDDNPVHMLRRVGSGYSDNLLLRPTLLPLLIVVYIPGDDPRRGQGLRT